MPELAIRDHKGKESGTIELSEKIFAEKIKKPVLHQAVLKYLASQRQGNASTKERGAVSGGGIKPWRQKGTGRARAGSIRSPLWKGGGVVFGPHPRDFAYDLPKGLRRVALRESLNAKYHSKDLFFVSEITEKIEKTKDFAQILKTLKLSGKILAILDGCDASVNRASRNIAQFQLTRSEDVTAWDILKFRKLLITKTAFDKLVKRIES